MSARRTALHAGAAGLGRLVRAQPIDQVPLGGMVDLPGRGSTYVTDSAAPGTPDADSGKPAVILLHSVTTTGQLCWYPSIPALAEHFRVITLDQRWHGRGILSDEFHLDDCADDVAALADVLGLDRFAVAGFSMGGGVAQLVAHRHADRTSAMVLCSTGPFFSGHPDSERTPGRGETIFTRFTHKQQPKLVVPTNHAALDDLSVPPGVWGARQFRSTPFSRYRRLNDGLNEFDSRDWLDTLQTPTAVCISTRDRTVAPSRQQLLVDGIPGARRFDIDAGHACCVMQPGKFVPTFVEACRSVVPAKATPTLP
ncbi:alpha/beta fold hydrolase [Jongsikchunia kroppenstedtii]|uniref:alpha/beta fold hydrolase n=1 Tax=Jongsikchunia kroppenstedtii TaxID=1121721 RepID=UPI000362355E|nr:alpha/beta hydrolase [Jongsikchunia kroppenstedtii]